MTTVLTVIHLLLSIGLVGVILLQRSEGGGLGIGGGGGMSGFMTGRATANLLTRATAILAACFMGVSLTLAVMANHTRDQRSILDQPTTPAVEQPAVPEEPSVPTDLGSAPAGSPASEAPAEPARPSAPAAPLAR